MKTQQTQTLGWDTSKSPFHAQAHSPLPWSKVSTTSAGGEALVFSKHEAIATTGNQLDAAFIVRACNECKDLLAAHERQYRKVVALEAHAQRLADALRDCLINDPKHFTPAMNAALAQWEGSKQ